MSLFRKLETALKDIVTEDIQGIYLFGSYISGEPSEDSDLDVGLLTTDIFNDYSNISDTIEDLTQIEVDLVVINKATIDNFCLLQDILGGVCLYATKELEDYVYNLQNELMCSDRELFERWEHYGF